MGQTVEPLDDGVDDPERHRVDCAGHRLDLMASLLVGALQHVLARQLEVARVRGHERGEQLADLRRCHLAGEIGDGAAVIAGVIQDARFAVGLDRRQAGDDPDGPDQRRVAGGDCHRVHRTGRPTERRHGMDVEVGGEGGHVVGERPDRPVGVR